MSKTRVDVPTHDADLAGFTYVKRKSRTPKPKKSTVKKSVVDSASTQPDGESDLTKLKARFTSRQEILVKSQFFKDFQQVFGELSRAPSFNRPKKLKMLGIGTLTHNPSLTQLAFGLELASMLGIAVDRVRTSDPMYTATDTQFLTHLGLVPQSVEAGNQHASTEGTDADGGDSTMLLFAPHVPKSVYESILRAYWSPAKISTFVLLGNQLKHYPEIYSNDRLKRESPAILAIGSELECVQLPGNFEYNNVFNDLAIQWYKPGQILPKVQFEGSEIEKENFEINQDDVEK